ncbi:MAG: hypothetical protein N4A76_09885 [Firmicutes bacterium]|jgi:energy-converting hydrogenase Eha subunit B|nr:hypothetical protein [Bacillota bacterium]
MSKSTFLFAILGAISYFVIKYICGLLGLNPKFVVPVIVVLIFIVSYFLEQRKSE